MPRHTPAHALATARSQGKSLFETNPLMAIGILLQSVSAGVRGEKQPFAGLSRDAAGLLEKDRTERQRQFNRARDTSAFVATVAEQLKNVPEELHDAIIGPAVKRITESLGGDEKMAASLRQEILALRERPEEAERLRSMASADARLEMSIGHFGAAGRIIVPGAKGPTRNLFQAGLERSADITKVEEDGKTIFEVSLTRAIPALERIGQTEFPDDEMAVLARVTAGRLFTLNAKDSETGNPAFVRLRDPALDVQAAEAEAKLEPIGKAAERAGAKAAAVEAVRPKKADFLDDLGNLTVGAANSLRGESAALFGGLYDPASGQFIDLDPKSRRRAQEITARAAKLLRTDKAASIPEAVQSVLESLGLREDFAKEAPSPEKPPEPGFLERIGKALFGDDDEGDAEPPAPGEPGSSRDNPVPVKSTDEAKDLPEGTWFKTPGGRVLRRGGS